MRCCGCGAVVERITPQMRYPVPPDTGLSLYGRVDLDYIVCAPMPDGTQPCLDLALLGSELRCRGPGDVPH